MTDEIVATILWTRLDQPGHDCCRLIRRADGWKLAGHAVFEEDGRPWSLAYAAAADASWRTRSASVSGWVGTEHLDIRIERRDDGRWMLNGTDRPAVAGQTDVDLGFTPATNLLFIRRANLAIGQEADAPAAYLRFPELDFVAVAQTYRRVADAAYDYASPAYAYHETLTVDPTGFVTDYPRLWRGRMF